MSFDDFLDGYEFKARIIPSVIVLLPVLWTVYFLYPKVVTDPFLFAGSGVIALALMYLCGMILKDMGTRYASRSWAKQGGAPSTQMGRMRDPYLSVEQKRRIHLAIQIRFGIELLSLSAELQSPALADRRIVDAFREVKELLRHSGQASLVDKHNAEYGAARNLCGGRALLIAFAMVGGVACQFKGGPTEPPNAGSLVNLALILVWLPLGWSVLPKMLRVNANNYAESAWMSFLVLEEPAAKKPSLSLREAVQNEADWPRLKNRGGSL
jgi:hypothetical protein